MFSIGARRFQIKEQPTSLNHKLCIMDEHDACLYTVKSTLFSLGDKLTLSDSDENEIFQIRQQLRHLHLTFHIYNAVENDNDDKRALAVVKQVGFSFKHTFDICSIYGDYFMKRDGGITSREYTLSKGGSTIAKIQRKFPALFEQYTVDIDENVNEKDIPFILTLAVTLWCAQRYRG
jgi:uncharacterized protein YxjI